MGLTKQEIDAARFDTDGPSWQVIPDEGQGSIPGLAIRLLPSGRKSFVLRYYTKNGRRRYLTIGPYGGLSVKKARGLASIEIGKVKGGEDPAEDRQSSRQVMTFRDFSKVYLERMAKRWAPASRYEFGRRIEKHLIPKLGPSRLDTISRATVANLLEKVAEKSGKTEANRVHELVRAMLNRAAQWGFYPEDRPNPARHVERFKERSRDRWLKPEEVEILMEKVREQPDPYFKAFVPLALFTGMRKGEILSMKWAAIDFDRGEVLLPKTKSGKPQTRKLSKPALEIVRFLPREVVKVETPDGEQEEPHPYVFPGRGTKSAKGSHRDDFKREWNEARTAAGLAGVTLHDLRRTSGSYMAQAGIPLQVIGDILGHQHPSITKIYARLSEENERDALEALGEKLSGLMKQKKGAS